MLSAWSFAQPASAQALVPHTLQLNGDQLEQQGLSLAQEAAQLAQFQQYELALPRAQLASQLAPNNHQVWSLLGSLYLQANELDKGITALEKARSLDQNNPAVLFALGSASFQKAEYNKAADYLQAGLKLRGMSCVGYLRRRRARTPG